MTRRLFGLLTGGLTTAVSATVAKRVTGAVTDLIAIKNELTGNTIDRRTLESLSERIIQSIDALAHSNTQLAAAIARDADAKLVLSATIASGIEVIALIAALLQEKYGAHDAAERILQRLPPLAAYAPDDDASRM
jgi:hypothetical protein